MKPDERKRRAFEDNSPTQNDILDDLFTADNIQALFKKAKTPVEKLAVTKSLHDLQVQRVKQKYGPNFDTVLGMVSPSQDTAEASVPIEHKEGLLDKLLGGPLSGKNPPGTKPSRPMTSDSIGTEKINVGAGMTGVKNITPSGGVLPDQSAEDLAIKTSRPSGLLQQLHDLFGGAPNKPLIPIKATVAGVQQDTADFIENLRRTVPKAINKTLKGKTDEEQTLGILNKFRPGMTKEMVRREITQAEAGTPIQIGNGRYILKNGKLTKVA